MILEGGEELSYHISFLERVIARIYPGEHAKKMRRNLHGIWIINHIETPQEEQENYIRRIKRAISVIALIAEEDIYFGFEDFTPIKEEAETEFGLNKGKPHFLKRKKKK